MRRSLKWAAVGATVAAAALSVAGMASAGATAVKPTTLSIEKSASSIVAGSTVTVSGQLKSGKTAVDRQAVWIDWVGPHGVLHPITRGATSGPAGNVSFKLRPTATTTYELVFNGGGGYGASHSGMVTVPVTRIRTALGIKASATTVEVGSTATLTGTLTAGKAVLGGRLVLLDTVDRSGHLDWTHRAANTDKTGVVSFTVKPGSTTTYELVFAGNWQYTGARSVPAKITVTKIPTSLVAVEAAGSTAGTATITGTLTAGTAGLGSEVVTLQVKDAAGTFVNLRSKATAANGTVTFDVSRTTATTFRLFFATTPVYAAAVSNTVIAG